MPRRGSLVVLFLLFAGLTASVVAVWYHRQKTRQALELWGAEGALLIERAPDVTLYRLADEATRATGDVEPGREVVRVGGRDYVLWDRKDMKGAAGFSHVRWGLCQDSSYAWQQGCDACESPNWNFAIRFADGDQQRTIALDTACAMMTQIGDARCVSYEPIAKEVETVIKRQLPDSSM